MKYAAAILVAAFIAAFSAPSVLAVGGGIGGGQLNSYVWTSDPTVHYEPNISADGDGGTFNINPAAGMYGVFIDGQSLPFWIESLATNSGVSASAVTNIVTR